MKRWAISATIAVLGVAAATFLVIRRPGEPRMGRLVLREKPSAAVTFNREVAPLLFRHCVPCHRPDGAAPFGLLTYADAGKRARQIAEVTASGYMPPWLPEPGYGDFLDARRLEVAEVRLLQEWATGGAAEGSASESPVPPKLPDGWELGQPDLVITPSTAYALEADGRDVYRNVVMPIPTKERRFVRAVDFRPGNARVVHHAFIHVDPTRQSRYAVDEQAPAGFDGMRVPESAEMPGGQLLGWQPGKRPYVSPEGLSWVLEPDSDLILQMHLQPSGKAEMVLPSVAFYFTDRPPTNTPYRMNLLRYAIDIPPGVTDHPVENRYVLPVDVEVLRVLPHAHYLGKELQGYAILPDGTRRWLLRVRNWDFKWQGDYRYAEPVFLPKGTTVVMHYTYDNSAGNIRNPTQPPRRVRFGLQATDEMAEFGLQVLTRTPEERQTLARDFFLKFTHDAVDENERMLASDPGDAEAHTRVAIAKVFLGRTVEALNHLRTAVRLRPDHSEAQGALGGLYLRLNQLDEARAAYETVVRLKPRDYQAFGSLGLIHLRQGRLDLAEASLVEALRLNPADPVARGTLERVHRAQKAAGGGP